VEPLVGEGIDRRIDHISPLSLRPQTSVQRNVGFSSQVQSVRNVQCSRTTTRPAESLQSDVATIGDRDVEHSRKSDVGFRLGMVIDISRKYLPLAYGVVMIIELSWPRGWKLVIVSLRLVWPKRETTLGR
jgi:hypothetical protein